MNSAQAKLVQGYGVASGKSCDSRFPAGTLALQFPFFKKHGLDLSDYYQGTLNLDLGKTKYFLQKPIYFFQSVKWCSALPAENFSFYPCVLHFHNSNENALVYWPHPSTKPEFHQKDNILELVAAKIPRVNYGDLFEIEAKKEHLVFQSI